MWLNTWSPSAGFALEGCGTPLEKVGHSEVDLEAYNHIPLPAPSLLSDTGRAPSSFMILCLCLLGHHGLYSTHVKPVVLNLWGGNPLGKPRSPKIFTLQFQTVAK